MQKISLKTIVVASAMNLSFLGAASPSYGMWKARINSVSAEEIQLLEAEHTSAMHYNHIDRKGPLLNAQIGDQHVWDHIPYNGCCICMTHVKTLVAIKGVNERIQSLEDEFTHHKSLQQREQKECKEREDNISLLPVKEEMSTVNIIPESSEDGDSLLSTVKSLRHIKLQHEETIKSLNEEAEESTENIKKMMKIIGIKTDDFDDCAGNAFAKKCLDRLKDKMGNI